MTAELDTVADRESSDHLLSSLKKQLSSKLSLLEKRNEILGQLCGSNVTKNDNSDVLMAECNRLAIKAKAIHARHGRFAKRDLIYTESCFQSLLESAKEVPAFKACVHTYVTNGEQLRAQNVINENVLNLLRKELQELEKQNHLLSKSLIQLRHKQWSRNCGLTIIKANGQIVSAKRLKLL